MRADVNLATNPATSRRAFWLAASVVGGVVLILTLVVGIQAGRSWRREASAHARRAGLEQQLGELQREQKELATRLSQPAVQEVLARASFYNGLIRRKSLSWTRLFVVLERHLPDRVRILALSPQLEDDGSLRLEMRVGAESALALIQFLRALEQGAEFAQVAVHSQQRGERPGEEALVAEISAAYRGGD